MKRIIDNYLERWSQSDNRKVLLVRGARQVGKTYSVRNLSKKFQHFIEINFDIDMDVGSFFGKNIDPATICSKISAYFSIPIIPGKTLLFLDEIQECIPAIRSLRYFYERMPELHVIAAGSLLEFALEELPSFGVGRISSLYMYPMNFFEYVEAVAGEGLVSQLMIKDTSFQIDQVFHQRFLELYREYSIVGGMPQVVDYFRQKKDFLECQTMLDELISSIKDDFSKYRTKLSPLKLRETLHSIACQSGNKFKYSRISNIGSQDSYKKALELLSMAGLAHKVYHTNSTGIPIGAQINHSRFKVIPFDMGIMQRMLSLDLADLMSLPTTELINKGSLAEVFVGLELISSQNAHSGSRLYYWHREARSSNAELDYLVQKSSLIVPVEVKSGRRGSMQSLAMYMEKYDCPFGVRLSLENLNIYKNVYILPIYLAGKTVSTDFTFKINESTLKS